MKHLAIRVAAFVLLLSCGPRRAHLDEGRSPEPAGLAHRTYTIGGAAPAALLVALHYSSSTPQMWDEHVAGWDQPVRVLLPRGPWPRRAGFTWVPADHEQKDVAGKTADVERMAAEVAELIRSTRAAHPEIRRVAVTGFSYGGDLAWVLAMRYPELVDAAVPMGSRLLGEPPRPPPSTRVLVLHGEADAIIDARQTAARVQQLEAEGVAIELRTFPALGHDLSPPLLAQWRTFLHQELHGAPPR